MTREQMVAEFGAPGVQNPMILDLITTDAASGKLVLVMVERRAWNVGPEQFRQIEEKINRYLGYVLDGFLVEQYPQYQGRQVRLRLDCAELPAGDAVKFVEAATHAVASHGMEFVVSVVPSA
jgi:hypothetical protein